MITPERLNQIAKDCADLTAKKNASYGNSFSESGEILKILMPKGCPPEKFQDMLTVARIIDKLFRICTNKDAFNEDPWRDILGYALLMCASKPDLFEVMGLGTGKAFSTKSGLFDTLLRDEPLTEDHKGHTQAEINARAKADLSNKHLYATIKDDPIITGGRKPGCCFVCGEPFSENHRIHTQQEYEKKILATSETASDAWREALKAPFILNRKEVKRMGKTRKKKGGKKEQY